MDEQVEYVARCLFDANPPSQDDDWDLIPDHWRGYWRKLAAVAIKAVNES